MPPVPSNRVSIVELRGYVEDGCKLNNYVNSTFDELDANRDGKLSKAEIRPAILHMTQLLGLPSPESKEAENILIDEVFQSLFSDNLGAEIDRDTFTAASREIFSQILEGSGNALFDSLSDGAAVRKLLSEKEDAITMAEMIFDELDEDKSGKLGSSHIKTALHALGFDERLSSHGEDAAADAIISEIITKYGRGTQFILKEDFLHLLEDMLAGDH